MARLADKNIFVTSANSVDKGDLVEALKAQGAKVVVGETPPHDSTNLPDILKEIYAVKAKGTLDAVVVHDANVEMSDGTRTVKALGAALEGIVPVIAFDKAPSHFAGDLNGMASYVNSHNGAGLDKIAYAVADRVEQQGKGGRGIGGSARTRPAPWDFPETK